MSKNKNIRKEIGKKRKEINQKHKQFIYCGSRHMNHTALPPWSRYEAMAQASIHGIPELPKQIYNP